jgi:uncharacterized protein (TIRG00374 family)
MSKLAKSGPSGQRAAGGRHPWLGLVLKLALLVGVVGLILYFIDVRELAAVISNMNIWLLLPVVVLFYMDRALSAYKWRPLLKALGVKVPFMLLMKVYLVAPLVGLLIPATVARDGFRFFMLSRYRVDRRSVLASIIAERVIGFMAMLVLVLVSMGVAFYIFRASWSYLGDTVLLLVVGTLVAGLVVGAALGRSKNVVDWLARRLTRVPFVAKLHQVYGLYSEYRNHLSTVARVFGMTFVEQMVPVLTTFLLARALNIEVSLLEMCAVIPVILLLARLPLPLEGLGVTEGLSVVLLGLFGVSATEAVALSLVSRLAEYLSASPFAVYYLFKGRQALIPERPAEVRHSEV